MSLPLIISGQGFYGYPWLSRLRQVLSLWLQGKNYTSTRIFGAIYTVSKLITYNPGVSLPLNISGHGFCGYPWLSRSEGGPFSLANREELTLVLGFWELYVYTVPKPIRHNSGVTTSDYFRSWIRWLSMTL